MSLVEERVLEAPIESPQVTDSPINRFLGCVIPNPGFAGWKIVLAGFAACALSSPGQTFLISLFIEPLMAHLDVSRVAISSAYSVATLGAALMLPFVGALLDRLSARWFFGGVMLAMGVVMIGLPFAGSLAVVGVGFFLLRLLGQGAIGLGTIKTTAVWFDGYRARAIAITGLGFAFGELVFPGIFQWMLVGIGWQNTLIVTGLGYILIVTPAMMLAMRPRLAADGFDTGHLVALPTVEPGSKGTDGHYLASFRFWALLAGGAVYPFAVTALIFHQVGLVLAYQWPLATIPVLFGAFAVLRIASTYAAGLLFEKIPTVWGVTISSGFLALACGVPFLAVNPTMASLLYGALLGLGAGVNSTCNGVIWQERYGIDGLGRMQGTVNMVRTGVTAASAPAAAWVATAGGSMLAIPVGVALLSIVSMGTPLLAGRGRWDR